MPMDCPYEDGYTDARECVTCDTVGDIYRTGAAESVAGCYALQCRRAGLARLLTLVGLRTAVPAARLGVGGGRHRRRGQHR